jgi:hypothetical protein
MKILLLALSLGIVLLFSNCGNSSGTKGAGYKQGKDTSYLSGEDSVIIKEGDTVIMDLSESHILPMK